MYICVGLCVCVGVRAGVCACVCAGVCVCVCAYTTNKIEIKQKSKAD